MLPSTGDGGIEKLSRQQSRRRFGENKAGLSVFRSLTLVHRHRKDGLDVGKAAGRHLSKFAADLKTNLQLSFPVRQRHADISIKKSQGAIIARDHDQSPRIPRPRTCQKTPSPELVLDPLIQLHDAVRSLATNPENTKFRGRLQDLQR